MTMTHGIKARLDKLERATGKCRPYLYLTQSLDDPAVYTDHDGRPYTRDDFERLGQDHQLIIFTIKYDG